MVLLTTTPDIFSALESLPSHSRTKLSLPPEPKLGAPISHSQIITLSRHLTKTHKGIIHPKGGQDTYHEKTDELTTGENDTTYSKNYSLDSLLRGMNIYVPPPPPKPEPSAEYLVRKSRLRAAAEANAYNNLLQPGPISGEPHRPSLLSISSHPRIPAPKLNNNDDYEDEDHLTPSLVLNILLSILLTGFSTYWAISHFRLPTFLLFILSSPSSSLASSSRLHESYPGSRSTGPVRVFISFAAAVVVGVAEVVIYAAFIRKMRTAREKEDKIVERKKVEFMVDGVEGDLKKVDVGEKDEIWGRGVNGGVRRRVREKWEDKEGVRRLD